MRRLYPFCILLLIAPVLRATVNDVELRQILDRHVEAIGGRAAMNEVNTIRMRGHSEMTSPERQIVIVRKRPNLIRLNIIENDNRLTIGYDGRDIWQLYEKNGQLRDPSTKEEDFSDIRRDAIFWPPVADYENSRYHFELLDEAEIDGRPQYVIATEIDGFDSKETYYLDKETLMVTQHMLKPNNGKPVITTKYADYQKVKGVNLPYYIETNSGDDNSIGIRFESVDVNKGVFDSYFKKP